jgi:hypothetical protein
MSYFSPLCFIVPALIAIAASATAVTKILEAERGARLTLAMERANDRFRMAPRLHLYD